MLEKDVQFRFMTTQNRPQFRFITTQNPLPFVVVVTASLSGGAIAMLHKLWTDPQLRRHPAFSHRK
ncbi:20911_t:CDS:2 [Racocetra persica]|uniref:20911_t:CDS:1 n=1 Tax=Racocetra persica TaxID=160502 RepID=A0ACA9LCK8_9GLOM|nr:20911_t:CDS:2 [Racocetra persica]